MLTKYSYEKCEQMSLEEIMNMDSLGEFLILYPQNRLKERLINSLLVDDEFVRFAEENELTEEETYEYAEILFSSNKEIKKDFYKAHDIVNYIADKMTEGRILIDNKVSGDQLYKMIEEFEEAVEHCHFICNQYTQDEFPKKLRELMFAGKMRVGELILVQQSFIKIQQYIVKKHFELRDLLKSRSNYIKITLEDTREQHSITL